MALTLDSSNLCNAHLFQPLWRTCWRQPMMAILLVLIVKTFAGCARQKVILNLEANSGSAISTNITLPGVLVRVDGGNANVSNSNVFTLPVYPVPVPTTTNTGNATATVNFSP